jgi:hypothetical protein
MSPRTIYSASALLEELGISDPADIKIEPIAQYCGATVVYEKLEGCEARIIGHGDRAIITVNDSSRREQQRFSAGHELGHWMNDRGKTAFACSEAALFEWGHDDFEQRANSFAADLLLPRKLFGPSVERKPMTFETVKDLAGQFEVSLTATAIRLVEMGSYPSMLLCCDKSRRRWFVRNGNVPSVLWPCDKPARGSGAFELLNGGRAIETPANVDSDVWFTHEDAHKYVVQEDSLRITSDLVLSILWWKDESQILALQEDEEED